MTDNPAPVEVDGPGRPFEDSLLDKMVGRWKITGTILGRPIQQDCDVEWVLNHQFLKVHFVAAEDEKLPGSAKETRYEALVFFGYDNMSERYVAHWLDVYGGRFSEALGYGHKEGTNSIRFIFEYDVPLHNTITWDPMNGRWRMVITQKSQQGEWKQFADETFARV